MRSSRAGARRLTPWKNGNGRTEEIFTLRSTTPGVDFEWRLSVATLDGDSPYSFFPQVDRVQLLLSRGPLALTIDGERREIEQGSAVAFAGESTVLPASSGYPSRVLNLMVRRGGWVPSLEIVRAPSVVDQRTCAEEHVVLLVLDGDVRVGDLRLTAQDAVEYGVETDPELLPGAVAAVARIRPTEARSATQSGV